MACDNFSNGSNAQIVFNVGNLDPEFCHTTWQSTLEAFFAAVVATLPGNFSTFVIGSTEPSISDRDKLWVRLDASCNPMGGFLYVGGMWVRMTPHQLPPGSIIDYYDSSFGTNHAENKAQLSFLDVYESTYPGGGSTTEYTNPFWRMCDGLNSTPDLRGRFRLGSGDATAATPVRANRNPGDSGGEEQHTLVATEIPTHSHFVDTGTTGSAGTGLQTATKNLTSFNTSSYGSGQAHNTMPPFFAVYPIIRTGRMV